MSILSKTPCALVGIPAGKCASIKAGSGALVGALAAACLLVPSAHAAGVYDEAKVVNVEPLYERVSYSVPTEVCREEQVSYQAQRPQRRGGGATAPILGAVIGGAIGNAVGHHKRNRQVGTAVGALLGGSIGADIARNRRASGSEREGERRYRNEQVCHTEREIREEERAAGYRVTYAYAGQTHTTRMNRDPGPTLRVRVNVTPAG